MQEKLNKQIGIAPDSAEHIALLESKLKKLKKSNDKLAGKDLISSMSQFKEIFMQDYLVKDSQKREDVSSETSIIIETVDKSYLERKLLPQQPIYVEETKSLIKNDHLGSTINEEAITD